MLDILLGEKKVNADKDKGFDSRWNLNKLSMFMPDQKSAESKKNIYFFMIVKKYFKICQICQVHESNLWWCEMSDVTRHPADWVLLLLRMGEATEQKVRNTLSCSTVWGDIPKTITPPAAAWTAEHNSGWTEAFISVTDPYHLTMQSFLVFYCRVFCWANAKMKSPVMRRWM